MTTTTIVTDEGLVAAPATAGHLPGHYLSWGSIIAGAICAAAISILLLAFGTAIGLTAVSPWPNSGLHPLALAIVGAAWVAIVQVVGFGAGGYVAGRVRNSWSGIVSHEQRFRDGMHGFVMWALALLLGSAFAVSTAGGLLRGGIQATATVAAGAKGQQRGPADYGVDYLMRPTIAATAPVDRTSTWGDLRPSLLRSFSDGLHAASLTSPDRTYLASVVSTQTGMAAADAERRVDEAFGAAKTAEMKARIAGDKARKASALAAFLAAATLVIGCAAACAAAGMGGRHRDEQTEIRLFGTKRFW